ncbi:antigen WC1.1-like [Toxotes jaculatrix]|uniref:antigen WC1.1-like n=1 Tax=Toxotes jaculatrix TaxID=941984 RepID=UPI001B3AC299|nr:antigen WC1.1-like [Toxotes jaculatrix]
MKHQGEWRALNIKHKEAAVKVKYAQVACRQMGCGSVVSISDNTSNTDQQPAWEVNFPCQGSESTLKECRGTRTRSRVQGKDTSPFSLDVICSESVRLADSSDVCAGNVEVKVDQGWAPVCGDGFDSEAEKVVCREFGCGPPGYSTRPLEKGEGPVLSKEFQCKGNESRLEDCASSARNDCRSAPWISCTDLPDVRLVGGESHCKGTLEGKREGEWRPLSDLWHFWRLEHSAEVCQQLGCGSAVSTSRSHLPKSRSVWQLSTDCDRAGSFCKWWEESGSTTVMTVVCSEAVRLEGPSRCSGKLEVKSGQSWASVCESSFSIEAAVVACQHLGCGFVKTFYTKTNDQFQNTEHTWSPIFKCGGKEKHLLDCPSTMLNVTEEEQSQCERPPKPRMDIYTLQEHDSDNVRELLKGQRFAISCSYFSSYNIFSIRLKYDVYSEHPTVQTQTPVNGTAVFLFPPAEDSHQGSYQCDYNYDFSPDIFSELGHVYLTVTEPSNVRLVGEGQRCAGGLEVRHRKEWRPVSYLQSWSMKEAAVVCRQLNCGSAVSTGKVDNWAGPLRAWRFYSDCHGSERSLMDCGTLKKWRSSSAVQVVCSDVLLQPNITFYSGLTEDQQQDVQLYRGYSFTVSCSVEPQYPGGHFSLIFTGFNQTYSQTQAAVNHSAHFLFTAADTTHQGNYSCVYHNFIFSHNFSSESQSLSLTLSDHLDVMLDDGVYREDDNYTCCAGTLFVSRGDDMRRLSAESTAWDLKHASVVCRQLDCGSAISTKEIVLPNKEHLWHFFSDCDGSESALLDCGATKLWFSSSAIEVVCTGQQGDTGKN